MHAMHTTDRNPTSSSFVRLIYTKKGKVATIQSSPAETCPQGATRQDVREEGFFRGSFALRLGG